MPAEGLIETLIVEDEMGALGALHHRFGFRPCGVEFSRRPVEPGTGGVDERAGLDGKRLAAQPVMEREALRLGAQLHIVEGRALGREPPRVREKFDAQALGIADPGVVIGGREAQGRIEVGPFGEGGAERDVFGDAVGES